MKTMQKKFLSLFLAVMMIVSVIPMGTIQSSAANGLPNYGTGGGTATRVPANSNGIQVRLDQIVNELKTKFPNGVFTADGQRCYDETNYCDCSLYGIVKAKYPELNSTIVSKSSNGWDCAAFAKLITVLMFGTCKDTNDSTVGPANSASSYNSLRMGDLFYTGHPHWMIYISHTSTTVTVLDANGYGDQQIGYYRTYSLSNGNFQGQLTTWQSPHWDEVNNKYNTTYTVSYNANGGTGAPSSQTKTYGQTLTLSSTKPTRTGYTFLGWSTSSTATSATYSAGGSYTANTSATLYAVWQKNPVGIAVNTNNFPDDNFRNYVSVNCDKDSNGVLSDAEIKDTIFIVVENKDIATLKGIEYFTEIEYLNCNGNQLTNLDLSKNTVLKYFYCDNNQLTSLDLSKNTVLEILSSDNNQLTSLDLSKNIALEYLYCISNRLTNLDISKNNKLAELNCFDNRLTKLDVSKNVVLEQLYCSNNQITSLDVSKNTKLKKLYCPDNQLTNLDVSKNTELEDLACYKNELTSLDVSKNAKLSSLDCNYNQLTSLDVSKNSALWYLSCNNNNHTISVDERRTFNLTTLPDNFDVSKASAWNGGNINGNILTVNAGASEVTYTYELGNGETETFTLIIANPVFATVSSISVQSKPSKTVYTVGDTFSSSGLAVKVNMSDGTSKTVTSGFTVPSPDMTTAGTKTVTVTYQGKTATFNITVNKAVSPTSAQYKMNNATASAGSTVEMYVSVKNNPGIISLRNKITYDTSVMELVKVEDMKLLAGYTTPSPTVDSPYTLRWADSLATVNNTANGNIVKLTFKIKDSAQAGDYGVSVSHIEARTANGEKVEFADCSAVITVMDYIPGDVDGNGEVDDWDAIVLNRYLAGWKTEVSFAAADMDGDGELTDWDAIALERKLAGWDV